MRLFRVQMKLLSSQNVLTRLQQAGRNGHRPLFSLTKETWTPSPSAPSPHTRVSCTGVRLPLQLSYLPVRSFTVDGGCKRWSDSDFKNPNPEIQDLLFVSPASPSGSGGQLRPGSFYTFICLLFLKYKFLSINLYCQSFSRNLDLFTQKKKRMWIYLIIKVREAT